MEQNWRASIGNGRSERHRKLTVEDIQIFFDVVNTRLNGTYRPYSATDARIIAQGMNEGLLFQRVNEQEVGSLMRFIRRNNLTARDYASA